MRFTSRLVRFAACVLLVATSAAVFAERSQRSGDYTVHYNALPTTALNVDVARNYGIVRSSTRGFLNIAIVRGPGDGTDTPVPATVTASIRSLIGQNQPIALREVRDQDAIYYLGEFTIRGEEQLRFHLDVTPEGATTAIPVRFEQKFDAR